MYRRAPFFRGLQISQMKQEREFVEIIFTKRHWQRALYNTHELTRDGVYVNFSETNFVEVSKICKTHEIYGPRKERPMVYSENPLLHLCTILGVAVMYLHCSTCALCVCVLK